jgi:hypothetical protein
MRSSILLATTFLILAIGAPVSAQKTVVAPAQVRKVKFEKYYRTELYMGMSIPGGAMVSDSQWEEFLSNVVTPLFPDGFSVLTGRGQYREASGTIAKEPSHVLVFLYARAKRKDAGAKIESIRNEYKKRFAQESVLRVDISKSVSVSF